jgi:hypothetical protein
LANNELRLPENPFSRDSRAALAGAAKRLSTRSWRRSHVLDAAYDYSCRNLGANDLAELFYYQSYGTPLVDRIARVFPDQFMVHSILMMDESRSPDIPDDLLASESLSGPKLTFENWWEKLKSYLDGSVIVEVEEDSLWVPFFCARPAAQKGATYKYSISTSSSSSLQFKVGVPGVGGGFGAQGSVSSTFSAGRELSIEEQFQLQVNGLVLVREDRQGRRTRSFSPSNLGATRTTEFGKPDYILYSKSTQLVDIALPHHHNSSDSWMKTTISNSSSDHFEIQLPFLGVSGLEIQSKSNCSFEIEHSVSAGYSYFRQASSHKGHDISVDVMTYP